MKVRLALLGGSVALLAGCNAVDVPAPSQQVSLAPRYAATTSTTNISVPFNLSIFVACANGGAGELVNVSGDLHILTLQTISNSGNIVTKFHFQPQGVSGTGAITGDKYQATGVTQGTALGTGTFTFINNFRFIGQGPGNNLTVHENIHITVNANGDVTAVVDNINADCK